jgi:phosphoenolpyruvate carboxylase
VRYTEDEDKLDGIVDKMEIINVVTATPTQSVRRNQRRRLELEKLIRKIKGMDEQWRTSAFRWWAYYYYCYTTASTTELL